MLRLLGSAAYVIACAARAAAEQLHGIAPTCAEHFLSADIVRRRLPLVEVDNKSPGSDNLERARQRVDRNYEFHYAYLRRWNKHCRQRRDGFMMKMRVVEVDDPSREVAIGRIARQTFRQSQAGRTT